jgi:hydrogenase expression/formation protein HypE
MHDPTEGGLAGGLWELVEAGDVGLELDPEAVPVLPEGRAVCEALGLDPFTTIASGALLLAVAPGAAAGVAAAITSEGTACTEIGAVVEGRVVAMRRTGALLPRPTRDAVASLYESSPE